MTEGSKNEEWWVGKVLRAYTVVGYHCTSSRGEGGKMTEGSKKNEEWWVGKVLRACTVVGS